MINYYCWFCNKAKHQFNMNVFINIIDGHNLILIISQIDISRSLGINSDCVHAAFEVTSHEVTNV